MTWAEDAAKDSLTSHAVTGTQLTAGFAGNTMSVLMHVVEGQTPILRSSKWQEQEAAINF